MGFFGRGKKKEIRADTGLVEKVMDGDVLLKAFFGGKDEITQEMALQIPAVSSCISVIADLVAATPVKLYRESGGQTEEVQGDGRLRLVNDETGDTLNANDFWHALVRDYFLGKGGYAYIRWDGLAVGALYYVDERRVSIQMNTDAIYKDYDILVDGKRYYPHEFLKILRNTKDGAQGHGITEENSIILNTSYNSLRFENSVSRKAGSKKGFLKSKVRLSDDAMTKLKSAFRSMYSNTEEAESVVVLNDGLEWQDAGQSVVEMQLHENKVTNAEEISKLFHIPVTLMTGNASNASAEGSKIANMAKMAVIPVMRAIETAMNRDMLLESEKGNMYFAFDTKEMLKGTMKERFEAYGIGIDKNILQPDEVRYMEDLRPLGMNFVKMGLQDVLYDPEMKKIYTPNTGIMQNLDTLKTEGGREDGSGNDGTEG